jgi:hypothetical protein
VKDAGQSKAKVDTEQPSDGQVDRGKEHREPRHGESPSRSRPDTQTANHTIAASIAMPATGRTSVRSTQTFDERTGVLGIPFADEEPDGLKSLPTEDETIGRQRGGGDVAICCTL